MKPNARKALDVIRRCVAAGRFSVLPHFTERMDQRALFWSDVLTILDAPINVRDGGAETLGRPKWIVSGKASDGLALAMVCVLDTDERGNVTVFVTAY
jgi:hypothetical protein